MKKLLFLSLVVIVGLLQATILASVALWRVTPDLLLMLVVIASLAFDFKFALLFSVAAGAWKDAFGPEAFGINTVLSAIWCVAVVACSRRISTDSRGVRITIAAAVIACNAIALRLVHSLGTNVPIGIWLRTAGIEAAYTAACFALCFDVIARIVTAHEDEDKPGLEEDEGAGLEPDRDGMLY